MSNLFQVHNTTATAFFGTVSSPYNYYSIGSNEKVTVSFKAYHGNYSSDQTTTIALKNSAGATLIGYTYNVNSMNVTDVVLDGATADGFAAFTGRSYDANGLTGNGKPYSNGENNNPVVTMTVGGDGTATFNFSCPAQSIDKTFTTTLSVGTAKDLASLVITDGITESDRSFCMSDFSVSTKAAVTFKYEDTDGTDLSGIKADVVNDYAKGSVISELITDALQASFVNGGETIKYVYDSYEVENDETTVPKNGVTVTLKFAPTTKYSYVVKAVDSEDNELQTLTTLSDFPDTPTSYYWSKYIKVGGQWYETSSPYGVTGVSADGEKRVTYTESDIDYFWEGEDMAYNKNSRVGSSSGTDYSNGITYRNGGSAKWYTGAVTETGLYTIKFPYKRIANASGSTIKLYVRASDSSTTAIDESYSMDATSGTCTKENVSMAEGSSFQIEGNGYNSNYGIDYVTITKSYVNYTLRYVNTADGAELTTVVRQAKWGSVISIEDADKDVTVEEVFYGYVSDNLDNTTVAADGTTVVTITVGVPCTDPTYEITAPAGTSRKFTLDCETAGTTIYYSETEKTAGDTGWSTYSSEVTTSAETIWAYAAKDGYPNSEVISFATGAGSYITLNAPIINRTGNNTVTITDADQSALLGSPTGTLYYRVGDTGDFTAYSEALNVPTHATVYAYVSETNYANSATSLREISFISELLQTKTNSSKKFTSGGIVNPAENPELGVAGVKTTYYPAILDGEQWGNNIYFQHNAAWNIRSDKSWVNNNSTSTSGWIMITDLKQGDIVVFRIDGAAKNISNATYSEKYSYNGNYAYIADSDGNIELRFTRLGSNSNNTFYGIDQYTTKVATTIGATGWSTFTSNYPLDLSNMEASTGTVAAYYASSVGDGKVTMTSTEATIPAGEGIMLKGTPSATITIPVASSGSAISGNKLVGVTSNQTFTKDTENYANFYVLSNNGGKAEFQNLKNYLDAGNSVTINAGKAYLDATGVEGARLSIVFDDDDLTTGISAVNKQTDSSAVYNLQGQRVNTPTKGLYIVNGKKVVKN